MQRMRQTAVQHIDYEVKLRKISAETVWGSEFARKISPEKFEFANINMIPTWIREIITDLVFADLNFVSTFIRFHQKYESCSVRSSKNK